MFGCAGVRDVLSVFGIGCRLTGCRSPGMAVSCGYVWVDEFELDVGVAEEETVGHLLCDPSLGACPVECAKVGRCPPFGGLQPAVYWLEVEFHTIIP